VLTTQTAPFMLRLSNTSIRLTRPYWGRREFVKNFETASLPHRPELRIFTVSVVGGEGALRGVALLPAANASLQEPEDLTIIESEF